ncbi:hypothetical protein BDFB_013530 [Asbolus verrucosus]|uniref:Uncharacterized protein n=1 Tax=Asbolus verrucosus TaxID=1661398 RepID=A0A482W1F1_ASBVE|nr:hypothetical protein BDFB_013530 [Asbolus verrucosus]
MRETGNLTPSQRGARRPRSKRTPTLEEAVLEVLDENPNISIHNFTLNSHVNCILIHRILNQEKYHPYHYIKIQALTRDNFPRRVIFC